MKLRYLASFVIAVFLLSLLLSTILVQVQTQALTETRKSALMATLSESQHDNGSFPCFLWTNKTDGGFYETGQTLQIANVLHMLSGLDVNKATDYIVSKQSVKIGNLTLWGFPVPMRLNQSIYVVDPQVCCLIVDVMRSIGALDRLNRTALVDIALSRYNATSGAFHEPVIIVRSAFGIRNDTICAFPLDFHGDNDLAYAGSNMISTFLGVSILANLDALDMINTTKTVDWILTCRAQNGAFKPFPTSLPDYLPSWSSLRTNPFFVDSYGTGIAYTYAALGALKALNVSLESVVDVESVKQYALACQQAYPRNTTRFLAHPETTDTPAFHLTYYAIMTLHYIGVLDEERDIVSEVSGYILKYLQDPDLYPDDSWPLPHRDSSFYGLFMDFPPLQTTYFAVLVLNTTKSLQVLDEPTSIVPKTWSNLVTFSIIVSISTTGILLLSILGFNKIHQRKTPKRRTGTDTNEMKVISRYAMGCLWTVNVLGRTGLT